MDGETAPLKTKSVGLPTSPCCRSVGDAPPMISYQRTTERPPGPATVCCVQMPLAPPAPGSLTATAWVSRASRESRLYEVPACGTGAGMEKVGTVTSPSLTSSGEPATRAQCQTMTFGAEVPVPSTGEWAATMYPNVDASAVFAGTGVKATEPSALCRIWVASAT